MKDYTDEFSFILKPSSIKGAGVGVFATHGIKSGTKLNLNKEGGESRILNSNEVPEPFKHFCIVLPGGKLKTPKEFNHLWIVWHLNHSDSPNAEFAQSKNCYFTIRDIQEEEEILINYNFFGEPEEAKEEYYKSNKQKA